MNDEESTVLDCGTTIEQLSAYLDAGRVPYDPRIETCPECLNALDALAAIGQLSRDLIAEDAVHLPPPPETWFQGIMSTVNQELRSGRDLPLRHPDPRVRIAVTEGAVRSLMRTSGDTIDGLYVGRTEIIGEADQPDAPVQVHLTATVAWGIPIPETSQTLRTLIYRVLSEHTDLNITAVDVTVEDVHGYNPSLERR